MIIQHNLMSLNAHRQLGGNTNMVSKNLEKLSSGYKINRAGDDAAGLAISEKMRAQITGLTRAQANAQDGISLVQTAEGALTEVHSMLNRMVDLATQSSNGTMQADDRQKIQDEMDALTSEIDRISQSTNFNGINLLDGSLGGSSGSSRAGATVKTGAGAYGALSFEAAANAKYAVTTVKAVAGTSAAKGVSSYTFNYTDGDGKDQTINIELTAASDSAVALSAKVNGTNATAPSTTITAGAATAAQTGEALAEILNGTTGFKDLFEVSADATSGALTFTAKTPVATPAGPKQQHATMKNSVQSDGSVVAATETKAHAAYTKMDIAKTGALLTKWDGKDMKSDSIFTVNGKKFAFIAAAASATDIEAMDKSVTVVNLSAGDTFDATAATNMADAINGALGRGTATAAGTVISFKPSDSSATAGDGLVLQIGDTADEFNKVTVSVADMGVVGLDIGDIKVGEQGVAADSIATIKAAIETVSVNRSAMGALQNRLEHTINNLGVATENMTAAESRVRDVDMAKEMMTFTKNNVLTQAAQAMLAQANQQPQQVLQLLR